MEYSRGYDTNPARLGLPPISGSWFNLYAPEFLMSSNWAATSSRVICADRI